MQPSIDSIAPVLEPPGGRPILHADGRRGVHRVGVVLTLHRGRQPYQDQPSLW